MSTLISKVLAIVINPIAGLVDDVQSDMQAMREKDRMEKLLKPTTAELEDALEIVKAKRDHRSR